MALSYRITTRWKTALIGAWVELTLSQLTASSLITAISTSSSVSIAPVGGGSALTIVTAKLVKSTSYMENDYLRSHC